MFDLADVNTKPPFLTQNQRNSQGLYVCLENDPNAVPVLGSLYDGKAE